MISVLGKRVEVKTSRQHYIGNIIGHLRGKGSTVGKYDVKITEVFKGNKKVGQTGRFSAFDCMWMK